MDADHPDSMSGPGGRDAHDAVDGTHDGVHGAGVKRRDFMTLFAGSVAVVGAGAFIWPFIDSLSPPEAVSGSADVVDVDVQHIAPGTQISVIWRGKPVFISHRTPDQLLVLQNPHLTTRLIDEHSDIAQQPDYARNWHRSIDAQYGVLVGICTHLGCVPNFFPNASATDPVPNWPGGYLCPCHGSSYDLAGRVLRGSPARYNLPVPPYSMPSRTSVRIGQSPDDLDFDFDHIAAL